MSALKPYGLLIAWCLLLMMLPPLGAWLGGMPLSEYLRFPLIERAWDPLPYSVNTYWTVFAIVAAVLAGLAGLALGGGTASRADAAQASQGKLPPWAWLGPVAMLGAPFLAGAGQADLGAIALWAGLLIALNGDLERRTGHALATERPGYFATLFPAGALCGWLLHYLNLFLQSWQYPGRADRGGLGLATSLSVAYALTLPLLLSLRQWLAACLPGLLQRLVHGRSIAASSAPEQGWVLIGLASLGLTGAGIWPDRIYPLAWSAPLLLAVGLPLAAGRPTVLSGLRRGDWSRVALTAVAGLLLGIMSLLWADIWGPPRIITLSLLQGPALLGLPLPAYIQFVELALVGLWVGDQLITPWQRQPKRRFPKFPIKVVIR
jgi:hypothetical protein